MNLKVEIYMDDAIERMKKHKNTLKMNLVGLEFASESNVGTSDAKTIVIQP